MGPGLGFFHAMTQVMEDEDIRPKVDMIPEEVLKAHLDYRPDISITVRWVVRWRATSNKAHRQPHHARQRPLTYQP